MKKIFSVIATVALLFNSLAPSMAVLAQEASPESTTTTTTPDSEENGQITATVLPDTTIDTSTINQFDISTDKLDYSSTDTVVITGSGFVAGKTYAINITSSDDPAVDFTNSVTANDKGEILYSYTLDGNYRPNYSVYVKNEEEVVASTTFTDAAKSTTTNVNSNLNPSTVGNSVTFIATISAGTETINCGTVGFKEGASTLGTRSVTANVATFSTSILTVGTHSITAAFTPSASGCNYSSSTSTVLSQDVNAPPADTTPPVITLNGDNPMFLQYGSTYTEPGAIVTDPDNTGLAATITGSVDTFTIGSYTITYNAVDLAGNHATTITRTVNVIAADQTITFGALSGKIYGDADFAVSATASSGLAVTFTASGNCTVTGTTVHITGAGSCTIYADQAGNGNYKPAPQVYQSFNIAKADATINVYSYNVIYDGNPHTTTGSATGVKGESLSGLNLSGTTHTNANTYTDTWTFTDITGNYNNATNTITDVISKADAICTVTGYAVLYDGNPHTASGSCIGVKGKTLSVLDLTKTTHTAGGAYVDPWSFVDSTGNYNNKSGTVNDVIIAAQPPITITKKEFQNGSTIPVKIPSTISGWTATLYVCPGSSTGICTSPSPVPAKSSGGSNYLNQFRFDPTGQVYIYNLSTKNTSGFSSGSQFSLWIRISPILGDNYFKLATITIK